MSDQFLMAACSLLGLMVLAMATLKGWQGWLALKERELDMRGGHAPEIEGGAREGAARIEIADLKERIRKLEAIASGVDL
ncbi:hypothetical protein E5222_03025 [Alteraurantiacibacter aquimixticola]|uniref:Uncharacterized protein n=2 Tax=Alteraurantiacibacter aquimixticola TaxID=2489173 RepID=A0A4T3F2K7_9SPHN|nr:hypothetical protein E5222_03025 [Alteraurantiacibacter aquimixticola]